MGLIYFFTGKGQGKFHRRTDHESLEGEWKYSSTPPLSARRGRLVNSTSRSLYPQEREPVPILE